MSATGTMSAADEAKAYSRSLDIRTELEKATGERANQLRTELKTLDQSMANFRIGKLEKQRQDFLRKGEKRDALYIEEQQVDIRVAAGLQDAASGAKRKKEIAVERDKAMADTLEDDWKKDRANRTKQLDREIASMPWVANPKNAAIKPNGCGTCANAPARVNQSRADAMRSVQPTTLPAAKAAIAARWPYANKNATTKVNVVPREQIEAWCGKGAGGCVRFNEVFVPADASAHMINHETLHAMTSDEWKHRITLRNEPVNESMTEYFNRKMGYFPPGNGVQTKAYEGGQRLLGDYVKANPAREDALAKAYFSGDFSAVERLEDYKAAPGKSSFDTRMADWTKQLENKNPGGTTTVDDESLNKPHKH